jgi:hypothetical protein
MRERDKTRANMKDEGEIYKRRGRKRDQKDR